MPLPDSAPLFALNDLLASEERPVRPMRLARRSTQPWRLSLFSWRTNQFHKSEEGMLTLATVITVLGLVVLIAFLGNIGEAVVEKIEMQNDADAAAYSSALWMARGMNAVTTTNHLLGEVTALCVIHEAFGGPELDEVGTNGGWPSRIHEDVRDLNEQIRNLKDTAAVTDKSPYWPILAEVHEVDQKLIDHAVDNMADDHEMYQAGATIYDVKLTLKRQLLQMMRLKSLANLGYFVPPFIGPFPVGWVTAGAATAVHIYASAQIVLIVKEWHLIELVQQAALKLSPVKTNAMEQKLIPALMKYEDTIAKGSNGVGSVILQQRVQAALDSLDGRRGTTLSTFPAPRDLTLPLVKEPGPQGSGVPNWGEDPLADDSLDAEFERQLANMQGALNEASDKDDRPQKIEDAKTATEEMKKAQKDIDTETAKKKTAADKAKAAKDQAEKDNKPVPQETPEEKAAREESDRIIAAAETKKKTEADKRAKRIKETVVKRVKEGVNTGGRTPREDELEVAIPEASDKGPGSSAGFQDPAQLQKDVDRLQKLDDDITLLRQDKDAQLTDDEVKDLEMAQKQVQSELNQKRKDLEAAQSSENQGKLTLLEGLSGRNPSRDNLDQVLFDEEQEKYTQWMRAAYPHIDALRAPILGMMDEHLEKSRAAASYRVWTERYAKIKVYQFRAGKKWTGTAGNPRLLFNNSSNPGKQSMYVLKDTYQNNSSTKPRKGFEPWRKGVDPAEKYFTVMGFAYRPAHDGLFADVLYKSAHAEGNLAISQAMVYNANLETLPSSDEPGSMQPSVGWDTLNWETPVQAPEHGNISGASGSIWPWDLFDPDNKTNSPRNKVKLNWQAKLVPVTETRAKPARNDSKVPAGVRKVLDRSKKNFDSLIQH